MTQVGSKQILIVNAGGQYCHLIARRVREAGVTSRICSPEEASRAMDAAKGIIISGGPSSVYAEDAPFFPKRLFEASIPVLGICYGHQVLAANLGGRVEPGRHQEYGEAILEVIGSDTILQGLAEKEIVWMSHGDEVITPPQGFEVLARSANCPVAAMADLERRFFGLQFHPEVTDTPCGKSIIENFLFGVCQCEKDWEVTELVTRLQSAIRQEVADRHVLFFVSGGVDSTVAFTLCSDALAPDRVTGVFVDTGFMRKGERQQIEQAFKKRGWSNIRFVDEAARFLSAVRGVVHPEDKRKRIGDCFIDVQRDLEKELKLSKGGWMLGQGTIYPDTIESGGGRQAALIKTHHNRVPEIERMIQEGLVLEPLKEFYKDEVRSIGRQLGLPESIVGKNPFPGPGLAVRCLCSSEEELTVRKASEVEHIAGNYGLAGYSVPLRTVGVQGDDRSYTNLVILAGNPGLEVAARAARQMTRDVRGINRVAWVVSVKPGTCIDTAAILRNRFLTKERLDVLREADSIAHQMLRRAKLSAEVWQFPVVLLPLRIDDGETIALRPVSSSDAMTARHASLPTEFVQTLAERLLGIQGVDMVLYDVTDKPPATIEWE
jgi:GMP synthase (glutamine-hydrolysing)